MNFSFSSGNFHLHKFNHQNENHQSFSSNFNENHQIRYTNQNLINSQSTSAPTSQSGESHSEYMNRKIWSGNGKLLAGSGKWRFIDFFHVFIRSLNESEFLIGCILIFSEFRLSRSFKLNDSLWTKFISASVGSRVCREGSKVKISHHKDRT